MRPFMMLLAALAPLAALACPVEPSCAWLIQGGSAYVGPGDIVAFTAWYGLRGYSNAKAAAGNTKMMNIRKVASGEYCDVYVAANGGLGVTANCTGASDGLTVAAFCVVDCRVKKLYDQTGNNACAAATCDLVQGTQANEPTLSSSVGFVQISLGNSPVALTSANNFTPSSAIQSFSAVANRKTNVTTVRVMAGVGLGNQLEGKGPVANVWRLLGGTSGSLDGTATDQFFHAANGVMNGASSALMIDTTTTTGTVTASTTAGTPTIGEVSAGLLLTKEHGFINNYALSSGDRTALDSNMRTYWSI